MRIKQENAQEKEVSDDLGLAMNYPGKLSVNVLQACVVIFRIDLRVLRFKNASYHTDSP